MRKAFESQILALTRPGGTHDGRSIIDPQAQFTPTPADAPAMARALNAAFLIRLAGADHPDYAAAGALLARAASAPQWSTVAAFYSDGVELITAELDEVLGQSPELGARLEALGAWLAEPGPAAPDALSEQTWSFFYPEAAGIRQARAERVAELRARRTVVVTALNPTPLTDPAREILFTSNVLLTVPAAGTALDQLPLTPELRAQIAQSAAEPQRFWYDHPIQIGVEPQANEILYGLRGLDEALEAERARGNLAEGARATCLLSVSTTHSGLQQVAGPYLEQEIARSLRLRNLELYAFSEADTRRLIAEVLAPAAARYLGQQNAAEALTVFGVDGEYGRHYSFLKAVAALWHVLIDPQVKATFKIDLDQVFPQRELVEQAGASALEQFRTPLWGALGEDSDGQPVELGMIAGALVNERDIGRSLFTPDVTFPARALTPDEHIFFSGLPQALSTEAEMMARYDGGDLDGHSRCIQRIHVTGGTNGILVDALRRHRPFTPSFIGRAEDQAYLLSTFPGVGPRLAYLHRDGLIMRHDKEAFAQQAIQAAAVGKLVGDYVRLLYFSAYARALGVGLAAVKRRIDPFTGGFVSPIPTTLAYLRFAVKAATLFGAGQEQTAQEFVTLGAQRIADALAFVEGDHALAAQYEQEREGWALYFDLLDALEAALADGDPDAVALCEQARVIVGHCAVRQAAL